MNTKLVIIIAVLAFGLGVLAYPLIFGTGSEPIIPDILESTSIPDTVIVEKYIVKRIPEIFTVTVTDTLYHTETTIRVDTVYKTLEVPYFKSFKEFKFDYVDSKVWAWAESPVDSFKNELVVDWQTYFIEKQKPMLSKAKYQYFVIGGAVGLSAGLLVMAFIK